MKEVLLSEIVGRVLVLTINQPERLGALSAAVYTGITHRVRDCSSNPDVGAIVITGKGRAFSAGGDISEMGPSAEKEMLGFQAMMVEIRRSPKPVIACVNGLAFGGGFSLAIACDIVIAAKDAVFSMAFTKIGCVPDGGIGWALSRVIGRQRTLQLALTNERIDAAQAYSLGIVGSVEKDPDAALARAMDTANQLAAGPAMAFARTKHLLNLGEECSLEAFLMLETMMQVDLLAGEESVALRNAFMSKARA